MKKLSALLPEPGESAPLEDLFFSAEASLVRRLGTESVSDEVLSVMELIKNSYDADATKVIISLQNMRTGASKIEISDNGSGMTLEDLKRRWMRIATSWKRRKRVSPKYNRKMLGLKGIGRFAVENLSSKTTIISYPENQEEGFRILFDWSKYIPSDVAYVLPENYGFGFRNAEDTSGDSGAPTQMNVQKRFGAMSAISHTRTALIWTLFTASPNSTLTSNNSMT